MRTLTYALILLIASAASAGSATNPRAGKKLIEFGWDSPNASFVRANIEKMEQIPFDGVVYVW